MTVAEVLLGKVASVAINFLLNLFVLTYLVRAPVALGSASLITAIYTVVAIVKTTAVRRFFEHLRAKGIN